MTARRRKVVYKITYPNGKIYVGQDLTDSANYFGSAKSDAFLRDFSQEQLDDFSVRKQVLWSSFEASNSEVSTIEAKLIVDLEANNPSKGYNLRPKWKN